MTLEFLNPSRSFDEVRNAIRFIGHDGMFEVPFFVEVEALAKSSAGLRSMELSEEMYLDLRCGAQFEPRCRPRGLLPSPPNYLYADRCRAPVELIAGC